MQWIYMQKFLTYGRCLSVTFPIYNGSIFMFHLKPWNYITDTYFNEHVPMRKQNSPCVCSITTKHGIQVVCRPFQNDDTLVPGYTEYWKNCRFQFFPSSGLGVGEKQWVGQKRKTVRYTVFAWKHPRAPCCLLTRNRGTTTPQEPPSKSKPKDVFAFPMRQKNITRGYRLGTSWSSGL